MKPDWICSIPKSIRNIIMESDLFVIAAGGAGAKVIEALTHLCAASLCPVNVHVLLVDGDASNGNRKRALETWNAYQRVQPWPWRVQPKAGDGAAVSLFHTNLQIYALAEQFSAAETGSLRPLVEEDAELHEALGVVLDDQELDMNMRVGFTGRPNLGCLVMNHYLRRHLRRHDRARAFVQALEDSARRTDRGAPRVVVVGSVFGGTDTALLDYFEVSSLTMTNTGTPPVFASANLTGGLQGSPFLWDVSAAYATGFSAAGLPPGLSIAPATGRITGTPATAGVYDTTITATNAFGATTQTLRIVVRNTTGVLFREDFTSGLSSNWTTMPADTNYFTLLPGQMWYRADYGDVWASGNRPLHLYAVDVPTNGDFTVTLGVSEFVPTRSDSPQIGVIAWKDTDNYVRSIYYGSSSGPLGQGQFVIEQSGSPTATGFPLVFGDQPFLLRLQRANGVYTSSWSTNGVDFIVNPASAFSATFAPTKWGFYLGGDPTYLSVAVVDSFEVSSDVPPAITSQGWLTGAQLGAPFAWQITNSAGSTLIASNLPRGLTLNANGLITGTPSQLGAFDTVLIASNHFGVATQTFRIVVGGGDGTIFRDDFSGSFISGWNPLPSDTSYYHFADSNQLWLRCNNGDTWTWYNRELNLFTINAPGTNDWIATLAVHRYEPNGVAYNMLNLVAWTDYDNYIRLTYAFDRAPSITAENSGGISASVGRAFDFGAQPFLLRLIKQGSLYTGFLSTNGVDFVPIVTNAVPLNVTPTQIGFWLGNDPSYANTVLLDYFEVTASGPPVLSSPAQALAVLGQPFSWNLTSVGRACFSAAGLPAGLSLDGTNGLISGIPSQVGCFNVGITASNHLGLATQALSLIVLWPQPTNNLPPNLVSWWRGETNANDETGSHNGWLGGGVSFTNGWSGQGFALNGANSSVDLGNWFTLQEFTLSFWVKPAAAQPQLADLLDNNHTGWRSWVLQFANTSDGLTSQWLWAVPGQENIIFSLGIGVWQHLTISRDSNFVSRLYLNGTPLATNVGSGAIYYDGSQNLHLGRHDNLGRYFNGQIDELLCFNRPLASNEIAYLVGRENPYARQIAGAVELEGFVGASRLVTFKATDASGAVLKTWEWPLSFHDGTAAYALSDAPAGTARLSAKTAWHLRKRLPVTFCNGTATANFTDSASLRGGALGNSAAVDFAAYFQLAAAWYQSGDAADIDGNGFVDLDDYFLLANHWNEADEAE